jgi:hypothetical protein
MDGLRDESEASQSMPHEGTATMTPAALNAGDRILLLLDKDHSPKLV